MGYLVAGYKFQVGIENMKPLTLNTLTTIN